MASFGGFFFDEEVFADYMAEQPTWKNAIIASGILQEDATIMDLIGEKGNVATLPFYQPLSIDNFAPYNNDGVNNNTPKTIAGAKQTAMLIQRMMAWKAQDFTKELTGADPLRHVGNSVNNYYQQVWQAELMGILKAVMKVSGVANHVTDLSVTSGTIGDANKIAVDTLIYAEQKALGDMADGLGLLIMHSAIYARYKALGLVEFAKFEGRDGLIMDVELPTINGKVVIVDDRGTVDTSTPGFPLYYTYIVGRGAFLTTEKTNYERPYYTDYDAETNAGIEKLYTKQGRVLHPNGFSFNVSAVATDSPTAAEMANAANWSLAFDEKNIKIGQIVTNG